MGCAVLRCVEGSAPERNSSPLSLSLEHHKLTCVNRGRIRRPCGDTVEDTTRSGEEITKFDAQKKMVVVRQGLTVAM